MSYIINVSNHACDRLRERSGLNKKSVERLANRAYSKGLKCSELKGNVYKYVSSITGKSSKGCDIRIFGDKVFIFSKLNKSKQVEYDDNNKRIITLITVMQVPSNLVKQLNCIKNNKKEKMTND